MNITRPTSEFVGVVTPDRTNGSERAVKPADGLFVKCLLIGGTLVVCLTLLEFGLRLTGRFQGDGIVGYHAARGVSYGLRANVSKRVAWPTLSFTVYTDDLGFRAKQPGPRFLGGRPYCAVLGSSEVFGNGLDYERTLLGVFAEKAERNGIDVINMAVPAHHFLEQASLFQEFTASASQMPSIVLICLNPLLVGGYDDIHKNVAVRMGHLVDKSAWRIALAKLLLSNLSATYCFFRDTIRNTQLKYFGRTDYDLSFYVERYSTHHPIRTPKRTEDFLKQLKKLEDHIRSVGAIPVCVYFPAVGGFLLNDLKAKGQLDGKEFDTSFFPELIRQHCQSEGIGFIDVEPLLQGMYDRGEKLNFDLDAHFNGPTSAAIGEYLYDSLKPASKTASARSTPPVSTTLQKANP